MEELIFHFGNDVVFVRIDNANILFGNTSQGAMIAPLQFLKLSKAGVIKEHPDLENNPDWQKEAVRRFKEKIISLPNEKARGDYIIEDLKKHGYIPKFRQKKGFRVEKII